MKKLLIILLIAGISLGASAQHRYYVRSSYPRSHVVVSVGRPIYPYGYYDPFYDPYYRYGYYGYYSRPSKLDLEIKISGMITGIKYGRPNMITASAAPKEKE
jgi:hypothetical protein